jgi:hypothetical protein
MNAGAFRFVFEPKVSLAEAEMSLHLAMFAVEGLVGRASVRLDAKYQLDEANRVIIIDTSKRVGRMVARVFTGLLLREISEDTFRVERVERHPNRKPEEVAV